MTSSFNPYAPRDQSSMEILQHVRRALDELARSNPLQSAVVTRGLIKWIGNYTNDSNPDKINFLWIGEFFPGDPDMGGAAQRGFSLVRDDSRGGRYAIAMYDPFPDFAGSNLRQVLLIGSGDGHRLMEESRDGGQRWPEEPIMMGMIGDDATKWPGTNSATFSTSWEGRFNVTGNRVAYRVFCFNETGVASEHRLRISLPSGDVVSTTHTLGAGLQAVFDSSVDVAAGRGGTYTIRWESRRTAGVDPNFARTSVISMRCYTP